MDPFVIFLQHGLWPSVVLICLFVLSAEIKGMLGKIRGFKTGKIEVKFSNELILQGFTKPQLTAIRKLSAIEIDLFMLASTTETPGYKFNYPHLSNPVARSLMVALESAGLIKLLDPTLPENSNVDIPIELTPLGRHTRALFTSSLVDLLRVGT
jgi:hypothetical protein